AYVVVAAAGLYTHYFFPAVLVAHNVAVLIWLVQKRGEAVGRDRSIQSQPSPQLPRPYKKSSHHPVTPSPRHPFIRWSAIMFATLLLYAPWLPIFVVQFSSEAVKRPSLFRFLQDVWRWLLFGGTIEAASVSWAVALAFVLLLLGVVNGRRQALPPAVMLVIPIVFMFMTGTTGPEFFKFLVVSIPMSALIISWSLAGAWLRNWGRIAVVALLLLLIPGSWQSIANLYHNPDYARADYRAIAARIQADDHPNAGIILEAANQWEVFTYYFPNESIVYPFPKGRSLPRADVIDAGLSGIAAKHDRLYAIFWGEAQRDPERLVERWLDAHAFKATDEWIGDVRFVTYAVPAAAATEMETAVSIPFGDQIQLNGYTLRESNLQAGDIVQLTLFWQAKQPIDARYKIFLHLLDEQGQLVAQRDSEPGGGLALTTTWQPGQEVVDNHGILLPIDLPAGEYTLVLGLYDVADPTQRLPVVTETAVLDSWPVSTILVEN
ncbi:MAG: hypothetical protein KC421_17630, partial [Anaerolineales bacterium]|nr:hypothetical protein [Anaerolineales bacterium]